MVQSALVAEGHLVTSHTRRAYGQKSFPLGIRRDRSVLCGFKRDFVATRTEGGEWDVMWMQRLHLCEYCDETFTCDLFPAGKRAMSVTNQLLTSFNMVSSGISSTLTATQGQNANAFSSTSSAAAKRSSAPAGASSK